MRCLRYINRLFSVFLEPASYFIESSDPVLRHTASGQFMVLPMENTHSRLNASGLKSSEELNSLLEGASVVLIGMDEQCRRLNIVRIFEWRMPPDLLEVCLVVDVSALLVSSEHRADIGNSFK